jgi:hypothetical protein
MVHLEDLLRQRAVGADLSRGGEDDGDIEGLADGSMGNHLITVQVGVEVAGDSVKANLKIDNEQSLSSVSAYFNYIAIITENSQPYPYQVSHT